MVEISSTPPPMNSTHQFGNMVYCSISKEENILFFYNGGDRELEELASVWLQKVPPLHAWYSHTADGRTFGYLMEDGYTYFAINKPSGANLAFLEQLRDGFIKVSDKKDFHSELSSIVHCLMSGERRSPSPTKSREIKLVELNCGAHDRKKPKDKALESGDGSRHIDNIDRGLKIDLVQGSPSGSSNSLRRSISSKSRAQQHQRRSCWNYVKIAIAIDILFCLILFMAWLGVCGGFHCMAR